MSRGVSGIGRMQGGGRYTAHSSVQERFGELAFRWLEEAAAAVPPPEPPLPFVIADLGAAGGGNSLEPMRRALAARAGTGPALVVHTDIPANDFSALFREIQEDPRTYLGPPDVHALAAGRSFYESLFPAGFVSLAWSSIAVHWISAIPRPIPGHIFSTFATGAVADAFRERAAEDWRAFLTHRARELRPGGRMIVVGGAAEDDGTAGAEGLMRMADGALAAMVDAGVLTAAEVERMTIPTWNRTVGEYLAPFDGQDALELRRHGFHSLPDPQLAAYREHGDRERYAADVTGFFRAAFGDSLLAALDPERTAEDRAAIDAELVRRLRAAVAAAPERAACDWRVVIMDVARR